MKTQISRDSFLPAQHYSGVYLQQGRMILDADWNELTDIQKARLVDALRDAISGATATGGGIAGGAPRSGGLKVYANPDGSANIFIQPGTLYVDGVPACLSASAPLAVNAQPDYPIQATYPGKSIKLYADVWERSVSALERGDLMDAAMHGADTASRSQTMLQVKWCDFDPMLADKNPAMGNAPLKLRLRLVGSSGDACDPCASQINVDERIGNYLFRVEVHDYDATAGARVLTLKWSRDNGTEACVVETMPEGFDQGDWVWEHFDDNTEKLLGNHFASGIDTQRLRGLIQTSCSTPSDGYPKTYARQWDGYIKINLDSGALAEGRDRGVDLFTSTADDDAHGRVDLSSGVLKINLELMELELATTVDSDHAAFVPGDYWLAPVREAEHVSGQYVLPPTPYPDVPDAGDSPRGILHHYLFLAELAANGKLVAQDDAFSRRMNFPPLTDLHAADVGFTDNCAKLYNGAKNLQQALDNLCAISAEDIAYPLPNCGSNEGKSIKSRLFTTNPTTVGAALDKLLCELNATSLPYTVPACSATPSVRSLLGLTADISSNVAPILDKLLCELTAAKLPYTQPACPSNLDVFTLLGLSAADNTIAAVVDKLLCGFNAAKLPYTLPSCPSNPNVFTLLGLTAADNNVAAVLNKLLCGFNANEIPLDKSVSADLCSDLQVAEAVTVQDALKILCNKSGGGCAVTVSSAEQLELLLQAFADGSATDLWLCLKAGSYPITKDIAIIGKRSLRIGGQGAESTSIGFSGANLGIEADEVILENFAFTFSNASGQLALAADSSKVRGCHFSRITSTSDGPAMISVGSPKDGACQTVWRDNSLIAQVKTALGNANKWASETVIGNAKVSEAMSALAKPEVFSDSKSYRTALYAAANVVMKMSAGKRAEWGTRLDGIQDDSVTASRTGKADVQRVIAALKDNKASAATVMRALDAMASFWVQTTPHYALRLEHYKIGGTMEGNRIDGYLLLANGIDGFTSPAAGSIDKLSLGGKLVASDGGDLHLLSNSIAAIKANLSENNSSGDLREQVKAPARLTLSNNRIEDTGNAISAKNIVASGNYWYGSDSDLGYGIADRAVFTGNIVEDIQDISRLTCTLAETQLVANGNLLLQVFPMLV